MKRVVVVGAGITGLAAVNRLLELDPRLDVVLLDTGSRPGGIIHTERRDGFLLEHGPESFITDKPWGLGLARRLGLESQIIGTRSEHRRSFVVREGKLLPVPEGFQILAPAKFGPLISTPIFSLPGKARMALDLAIAPRRDEADESLGQFVLRRLGREALERMAQPMIAGIYGADPMELSLRATLPRFADMERNYGSVIRGMWARARKREVAAHRHGEAAIGVSGARYGLFVSFRGGMQTLIDALVERAGDRLRPNTRVSLVERLNRGWRLTFSGGEALETEGLILALPAYRAGSLLSAVDPELSELLDGIRYASAGTLNLVYRRQDVPHPLDGFGFVVPALERLTILGCTFSHVKWEGRAPDGYALLRVFLGQAALERHSDAELIRLAREDLGKLLGVTAEPEFTVFWRGEGCMPQYAVGHLDRVAEIERRAAELPGLALAGNAYRGVGIPDCIHSAEEAAERMLGL